MHGSGGTYRFGSEFVVFYDQHNIYMTSKRSGNSISVTCNNWGNVVSGHM